MLVKFLSVKIHLVISIACRPIGHRRGELRKTDKKNLQGSYSRAYSVFVHTITDPT